MVNTNIIDLNIVKTKEKKKKKLISNEANNISIVNQTGEFNCEIKVKKKRKCSDTPNDINLNNEICDTEISCKMKAKSKKIKLDTKTSNGTSYGDIKKIKVKKLDTDNEVMKKTKKVKKENKSIEISETKISENLTLPLKSIDIDGAKIKELAISTEKLENYRISPSIINKLRGLGINSLFPVQFRTYDSIYDGSDVIIQARTGSGKTLAFAIPIVEIMEKSDYNTNRNRAPKAIVLAPTRELAQQVAKTFIDVASKLSVLCVYGGVSINLQISKVRSGIDILVGTPGRILDILNRKVLDLSQLNYVVLDEVDRMLDMGFRDDVDSILEHRYSKDENKANPQTLLFSATLPDWIGETAAKYLKGENTAMISFISSSDNRTSKTVEHKAIKCDLHGRAFAIGSLMSVYGGSTGRTIIFTDKKREADNLALSPNLQNYAQVIHGDIPQEKRESVLKAFREGKFRCLIATDVAARGLDIPEVDLVIQCSVPENIDSYVHRSGRTGRAGRSGVSIVLFQHWEERYISWLQNKLNINIQIDNLPTVNEILKAAAEDLKKTFKEVPEATIKLFSEQAESFIKELGAINCVASAIAIISGHKNIKNKSLLSMKEDCTTYQITSEQKFNYISYMWKALENILPPDILSAILYMKTCADQQSCVFDLPTKFDSEITKIFANGNSLTIKKIDILPELFSKFSNERTNNSYNSRNNFNYNKRTY